MEKRRELGPGARISIVAPVFNEAPILNVFVSELRDILSELGPPNGFEIVLVDDGSTDGSSEILDDLTERFDGVASVHLARNFGHAAAVCAGLDHATGDVVVVMDSDLQDNPSTLELFLEKWCEGYDVVYAIRSSRKEGRIMRFLFWAFYRVLKWMANTDMPLDAGDFALLDRRVVQAIVSLPERNRYLPGLRSWVGFRQIGVPSPRRARYDSKARVGLRGLWTRAMNAIFSFSYVPLFAFRFAGAGALLISAAVFLFALWQRFFSGADVPVWATLVGAISFFGGINLLGISVIGEYVARIYDEVKGRPLYVVDRIVR